MENTLQFQQNASVIVSTGEEIGHISRVVMRPDTKEVTHIVVRMKALLKKEEKLVPIEQIAETTESQITLRCSVENLDALSLFEEKHIIPAEGSAPEDIPNPGQTPPGAYGTSLGFPAYIPPAGGEKFVAITERNIPEGTVAVEEGAKVITEEGRSIGKVEKIVAELPAEQVTHLVVSKGLMTEEKKLIPIGWVERMGEKEVYLGVKEDAVDKLAGVSVERN